MADLSFENRVVVVTGAGRGLGREYALAFAARGAAVVVNDLGTTLDGDGAAASQPADDVVAEIRAAGGRAVADHGSVGTPEGARKLIDKALEQFGQVDTVVNNAGILNMKPFEEVTVEYGERQILKASIQVKLDAAVGMFHLYQAVSRTVGQASNGFGHLLIFERY